MFESVWTLGQFWVLFFQIIFLVLLDVFWGQTLWTHGSQGSHFVELVERFLAVQRLPQVSMRDHAQTYGSMTLIKLSYPVLTPKNPPGLLRIYVRLYMLTIVFYRLCFLKVHFSKWREYKMWQSYLYIKIPWCIHLALISYPYLWVNWNLPQSSVLNHKVCYWLV